MKKSLLPTTLSPMLVRAQTDRARKHLNQELAYLKKELASLPDGNLYVTKNRDWILFYTRQNGTTRCISKDKKLIYDLARRQYLALLIRFLEEFVRDIDVDFASPVIASILNNLEKLLARFERGDLDLEQITMTPNQRIWNSDRSSQKTTRREDLIYPTNGGVYMRTKSEQTLGNLLERLHIPYRYETTVPIRGISYHPDFIIMLPSNRMIIIEHLGRLDLREYNEDLIHRLQSYNSIGLLEGRDVFFTFETDTRDTAILKEKVYQMLVSPASDNKYLQQIAAKAGCTFADVRA